MCLTAQPLSPNDLATIKLFAFKLNMPGLTERAFSALLLIFPDQHIQSWKIMCSHVQFLSGFQPVCYDWCLNSCMCYTAQYKNVNNCPECGTTQLKDGKVQKYFEYLPLIPHLCFMVANPQLAVAMCY